jgi:hypothetical protein
VACALLMPGKNKVEMLGIVYRVKDGEDGAAGVSNYTMLASSDDGVGAH